MQFLRYEAVPAQLLLQLALADPAVALVGLPRAAVDVDVAVDDHRPDAPMPAAIGRAIHAMLVPVDPVVAVVAAPVVVIVVEHVGDEDAGAEADQPRGDQRAGRIAGAAVDGGGPRRGAGGGRGPEIGGGGVDLVRVVSGHVDDVGPGRLDDDRIVLVDDDLLRLVGLEIAHGLGRGAQVLDGIEQVRLLDDEGVAQVLRPGHVVGHAPQDRGKGHQRLDAGVPGLALDGVQDVLGGDVRVVVQPAVGHHNFERLGRGDQNLHHERVGIERDRRGEVQKILARVDRRVLAGQRPDDGHAVRAGVVRGGVAHVRERVRVAPRGLPGGGLAAGLRQRRPVKRDGHCGNPERERRRPQPRPRRDPGRAAGRRGAPARRFGARPDFGGPLRGRRSVILAHRSILL